MAIPATFQRPTQPLIPVEGDLSEFIEQPEAPPPAAAPPPAFVPPSFQTGSRVPVKALPPLGLTVEPAPPETSPAEAETAAAVDEAAAAQPGAAELTTQGQQDVISGILLPKKAGAGAAAKIPTQQVQFTESIKEGVVSPQEVERQERAGLLGVDAGSRVAEEEIKQQQEAGEAIQRGHEKLVAQIASETQQRSRRLEAERAATLQLEDTARELDELPEGQKFGLFTNGNWGAAIAGGFALAGGGYNMVAPWGDREGGAKMVDEMIDYEINRQKQRREQLGDKFKRHQTLYDLMLSRTKNEEAAEAGTRALMTQQVVSELEAIKSRVTTEKARAMLDLKIAELAQLRGLDSAKFKKAFADSRELEQKQVAELPLGTPVPSVKEQLGAERAPDSAGQATPREAPPEAQAVAPPPANPARARAIAYGEPLPQATNGEQPSLSSEVREAVRPDALPEEEQLAVEQQRVAAEEQAAMQAEQESRKALAARQAAPRHAVPAARATAPASAAPAPPKQAAKPESDEAPGEVTADSQRRLSREQIRTFLIEGSPAEQTAARPPLAPGYTYEQFANEPDLNKRIRMLDRTVREELGARFTEDLKERSMSPDNAKADVINIVNTWTGNTKKLYALSDAQIKFSRTYGPDAVYVNVGGGAASSKEAVEAATETRNLLNLYKQLEPLVGVKLDPGQKKRAQQLGSLIAAKLRVPVLGPGVVDKFERERLDSFGMLNATDVFDVDTLFGKAGAKATLRLGTDNAQKNLALIESQMRITGTGEPYRAVGAVREK